MSQRGQQGEDFPVVGIGASAGGITALRCLLSALPGKTGLTFVVIQHLSPEHPSHLAEILGRVTALQVRVAAEGMELQRDCVYIVAPGEVLSLENGMLRSRPRSGFERPGVDTIDTFFESLATERGPKGIAVVLSGTGEDGAAGAIRIKQAGGMIFVQNPTTAEHDGMPCAVIAAGAVTQVLPLEAIARELVASTSASYVRPPSEAAWSEDVARPLDSIIELIRQHAGFDLTGYKVTPLFWRIQRRMTTRRVQQFRDYEALLNDDPAELEALVRAIPIHVTGFFRDPEAWTTLGRDVIDSLILNHAAGRPIRAWATACSSGEEAYSVAMLLAGQAEKLGKQIDFQVFGTDASPEIVTQAGRGVFSFSSIEAIPSEERAKFFYAADGAYRVKRSLREKMVFAPQHLLADPPFSDLDLITCRNFLIYLEPAALQRVLALLQSALRMGGYLFLGRGESLSHQQRGFECISSRWNIYRKNGSTTERAINFPKRVGKLKQSRAGKSLTDVSGKALAAGFSGRPVASAIPLTEFGATINLTPNNPLANEIAVDDSPALSDALRISIEDLEASREELQALNEELRAVNDQLNFSNSQLSLKIQELETQSNVLSSGAVMTLFLDAELRIQWFTPAVSELFPLRPGDIGRRLSNLVPNFTDQTFFDDARSVMRTGQHLEGEVLRSDDQRWYLRRIRPFRGSDQTTSGVAVNFTEITERKQAEEALRESREELAGELSALARLHDASTRLWWSADLRRGLEEIMNAAISMLGADMGNVQLLNPATRMLEIVVQRGFQPDFLEFFREVSIEHDSACGRSLREGMRVIIEDVETDPAYAPYRSVAAAAGYRAVQSTPLLSADGKPVGMLSTHNRHPQRPPERQLRRLDVFLRQATDFIERQRMEVASQENERRLRDSEQQLQRMLNVPHVGVLTFDFTGALLRTNDAFLEIVGYSRAEFDAKKYTWRDFTPPEYIEASIQIMEQLRQTGRGGPYEKEYLCKDGSRVWLMLVAADMGDGTIIEYAIDISDRKRAETELAQRHCELQTMNSSAGTR